MRSAVILIAASLSFSSIASGSSDSIYAKDHMLPLPSEKLNDPISLGNGYCDDVFVVEWRPTTGEYEDTSASETAKNVLKDICTLSVKNFFRFVKINNYIIADKNKFTQSIALMPAGINDHGLDIRNLNDSDFRFYDRTMERDENGNVIPIWGYHQRSTNFIYIRNDVLSNGIINSEFKTIFAHELFHAMSYEYGVFDQHQGDKNSADEKMARRYTRYLGLGE